MMAPAAGNPVVGIVMGSDSDLPVMAETCRVLESVGIAYEARVLSAHRMPDEMFAIKPNLNNVR